MSILRKATSLTASVALLLGAAVVAHADDTEIFVSTPPTTVNTRPNILFILDTSGSMDTQVVDKPDYDPARVYAGTCSRDRVYWKGDSDNVPSCGTSRWVSKTNFLCKTTQDKLDAFGSWPTSPAAQYRAQGTGSTRWRPLARDFDAYIECQADAAILHGLVDNDGKYPTDDRGPFTTNSSQSISWTTSDTSGSYIFYSGNYLNWLYNEPTTNLGTRLSIVKKSAKETLARLSNVNVGLMRYSSDADGGMVLVPLSAIEDVRTTMNTEIDAFTASGGTPLSETYLEAYRYLSGGNVRFGLDSVEGAPDGDGDRASRPSVDSSRTGTGLSQYRKPIQSACQKNFIVYLTDGDPTVDQDAEEEIEGLPNFSTLGNVTTNANNGGQCSENGAVGNEGGGATAGDGKCLDDLAKYMFSKDFFDDPALAADRDPVENVRTYTIGFGDGVTARGLQLMKDTATAGGGKFYEAGDTASLMQAFDSIIQQVLTDNLSFTAPAVSVNAFNRTQNLNDLFITVFKPTSTYHWPGNLKKYRLNPTTGVILDQDGNAAVDETKGFFLKDARSYWSDTDDGPDVESGGAANELPLPADRNLYTDLAAVATGATASAKVLSGDAGNAVADANALITADMLGMPDPSTAAERTALINWARGLNAATNTQRFDMGDPLHARPVSVIYGGTATAPEAVVFVATNDGYLHAINPSDGSELWAYIPSELLSRLYNLRADAASTIKRYGLDGNLTAYRIDVDGDGVIEPADGDKIYLFFGMGRGGDNYYALDVTSKTTPKFMWRNGADFTMTGLGQSWSTPIITKVDVSSSGENSGKLVAIISGGYDPTQDAVPYTTDSMGNRLFILDALSGAVLWTGGKTTGNFTDSNMTNSIPADVRVLDVSGDGFADRMYAADTGGQIWRFDIINGQPASSLVRGGVFASLGGKAQPTTQSAARRFYNAPDVSLLRADNRFYVNIAIGSGYRGHPLNTEIRDAFYSLRDPMPFTPMTAAQYTAWTPILHDSTSLVDVTTDAAATIPAGAAGWRLDLRLPSYSGEKVLAESRTFGGAVIFPTFTPSGNTRTTSCTAQSGTNLLYVVSLANGAPVLNRDGDATPEPEDRAGRLDQGGIAPPAAIFFPMPDENCTGSACKPPPVCLVGVEKCDFTPINNPVKTFWTSDNADAQ